jgi:hypothetical protein
LPAALATDHGPTLVATHAVKLQIGSNLNMSDEEVKQVLRCYLSERLKIAEVKEEKMRIE